MPNSLSFFIPVPGNDNAPSARGRCQKIVGLPSLPAVSVFATAGRRSESTPLFLFPLFFY